MIVTTSHTGIKVWIQKKDTVSLVPISHGLFLIVFQDPAGVVTLPGLRHTSTNLSLLQILVLVVLTSWAVNTMQVYSAALSEAAHYHFPLLYQVCCVKDWYVGYN
jgi:hypothetical protein